MCVISGAHNVYGCEREHANTARILYNQARDGGLPVIRWQKAGNGTSRMLCAEHAYFANEFFYTEMEDGEIIFG